ncbi:ATP-binding protein [Janthinobacterium sp. FW305-128]|uniref:ATP-binding protein n=1 Tax=Janthinobacterium sp. FW305-128 TaxID=2775055 RepID=UPI001E30C5EB|nr:ATP-binding protein [Janthinobacterium sp. FW305-128]
MMIDDRKLTQQELSKLLATEEDHFFDLKGKQILPSKLQESFVAFANADGGDLFIGIEDKKCKGNRLQPFSQKEEANNILTVLLEQTTPSVENVDIEFLQPSTGGHILHISIPKSPKVHYTGTGECFIRLNGGKVKIKGERITSLAYSKGSAPYERVGVDSVNLQEIIESRVLASYIERTPTALGMEKFLRKQRLLIEKEKKHVPNVGCVLLFDEEPQASIETRCAIKVYRLRTSDAEYKREHLAEMPATINGPIEELILKTILKVSELLDGSSYYEGKKLVSLRYPAEAIKEVLVNAVIHRDYSLNDDIHIRIFDNRLEISSPGVLPGYMTIENLYDERFSRNPNLVRMLHNLPDPLNHDIGEGLDTVRNELAKAGLVAPFFEQRGNAFVVIMRHQRIASIEDVVLQYLNSAPNSIVTNKLARQLSGEDDINKVKKALQKLRAEEKIEVVDPNASAFNFQYRKR